MSRPGSEKMTRTRGLIFDLWLMACASVWLSAAAYLDDGALGGLFRAKPWTHRLLVTAFALAGWASWAWRTWRVSQGKASSTPLLRALASLPLRPRPVLWGAFLLFGGVMTLSSIVRHQALHSSFDMAIFTQAIWNTARGRWFYSSLKGGINLLGDHFSPILAAYALPYKFFPDPRLLLALQAFGAAAGVFPLYRIALRRSGQPALALTLAVSFVLYLPLRNALRFDFHPEMIAAPLLLWAFYYLDSSRKAAASVFLALTLLTKEGAALVTFAFGLYAFLFRPGQRFWGTFWMILSTAWFLAVVNIAVPHFSGQEYAYLGGNFLAWKNEGPSALLYHLLGKETVLYGVKILAPLGFLSLLDPAFLLTLPMFAQNLLSRNEATRSIFFQYTAFLTPMVFAAAACGAARFKARPVLIAYLTGCALLMGGVSEFFVIREHLHKVTSAAAFTRETLETLPSGKSLRTHEFFAPHAAGRRDLHIFENQHPREGGSPKALASDIVVVFDELLGAGANEKLAVLRGQGYRETVNRDGLHVFEREAS